MADMSGEQMQAKITAARREAEGLKDKIRRRKDDLADTTRTTSLSPWNECSVLCPAFPGNWPSKRILQACRVADRLILNSSRCRAGPDRPLAAHWNEAAADPERSLGQDLRYALVNRPPPSRLRLARWKAHHLGCLYHKQGARHPIEIIMGYDLRLCTQWQLCRLRWSGQHLLNLQSFFARGPNPCRARALRTLGLPFVLSLH